MKFLPARLKSSRLVPFEKTFSRSVFKLNKGSNAGVIVDKNGTPQIFIFDSFAFLDVLSGIDDALIDKLSTEEYHNKSVNPAGWLIDRIESLLPLNPKFVISLKESISEAKKKGFIPFKKIEQKLGLI